MIEIIVVSHGTLSESLVKSAELIAGEVDNVKAFGLHAGDDIDKFKAIIEEAIKKGTEESNVLVLTDLMYGTPFNVVSSLMDKYKFHHITGINLPIYLEIVTSRKIMGIDELCKTIKEIGPTSFVYINEII